MAVTRSQIQELLTFRKQRDWEKFHTPKNLAIALVVEASELLECFQWSREGDTDEIVTNDRGKVEDEIADVAILLAYLCEDLGVDLEVAVASKIAKNAEKYPIALAYGHARKYDRL